MYLALCHRKSSPDTAVLKAYIGKMATIIQLSAIDDYGLPECGYSLVVVTNHFDILLQFCERNMTAVASGTDSLR
jgi:hypothetical protein